MQVTIKIKGILKMVILFVVIIPSMLYLFYRSFLYLRTEAIIYWKTNKVFKYKFSAADTSLKGYILLTPGLPFDLRYGKLLIMDMKGHIVYEKKMSGAVSDFRQWKINGHTRYTYSIYDPAANQAMAQVGSARHVVVLDSALNEIRQIHLSSYGNVVVDKRQDLDHHDVIMLGDDHFIVMAAYIRNVTNIPASLPQSPNNKTAVPIVQEIKAGKVVWQWDGSVFPDFYLNSELGNRFYDTTVQDYLHMNALTIDPRDSNLIVSFHNSNQLIKIDRTSGGLLWQLGGRTSDFVLSADQVFLRQHHPTITDSGKLLLLDNGESSVRAYSRILEFGLDEQHKTITSFSAFRVPAPFAGSRGSVQLLGNDYLICGGAAGYVLLADKHTGEKLMEIKTNQPLYRAWYVTDITGIPQQKQEK